MRERFKTARCILYRDNEYLLAIHSSFWYRREKRWGLPGGQIEWGETPRKTAQRELREELHVVVPELLEVGAYSYKRSLHMVYAAPLTDDILKYDDTELLDIGWFTETAVETMKADRALHADYELEAIRKLKLKLGR
jgi:ADP-ribose pyrophosphatase YjhB (NUDIX family)